MVKQWFRSGSPWIWMTGGAVSISLISVIGLLAMIAWKGLSFFWPSEVVQFELEGSIAKQTIIGEIYDR
ncbi:phosphate ABC transporter, permease protein PstA, partial [Salmonella enterica]|nr:phosphate ABC transporter, permease protein PstA [Salmonella enterica]